jgi:hypothetical protein
MTIPAVPPTLPADDDVRATDAAAPSDNGRPPLMLPPGPSAIAILLQRAGLFALPKDPGADEVELALRTLSALVDGADPLRVMSVRRAAVVLLNDRGVKYADRLVGAALKLAEDDRLETSAPTGPNVPAEELFTTARAILEAPDVLPLVAKYVQGAGYAGETEAPQLVYLAITSRLLERPVNVFLQGPSAAGKNFAVQVILPLFPPAAYYAVAGMSPLAVMYNVESFAHRMVVVSEASAFHQDGIGACLLRGLAWDAELKYDTVVDGEGVHLHKPGPTGLITTGTRELEPELATRLWTVTVPDDPKHTRAILQATAQRVAGTAGGAANPAAFVAAQQWLTQTGPWQVVVPFAAILADLLPNHEVRVRRDFTQLLTLVRAHALLHQHYRVRDDAKRVVADLADYDAVATIVGPVFQATLSAGLTKEVRATVQAVQALVAPGATVTVSATDVAKQLGLSPAAAWYRVQKALKGRWLVNDETRKRQQAKLRLGDPLPPSVGLPTLMEIVETLKRTSEPWATQALARFNERFNREGEPVETDPDEAMRDALRGDA